MLAVNKVQWARRSPRRALKSEKTGLSSGEAAQYLGVRRHLLLLISHPSSLPDDESAMGISFSSDSFVGR